MRSCASDPTCRLCDKSLAVRKRAIALLAALLAPAAGLAPSAAARLADAVLPVASRLLGVRPDSVLRPGEEALQVRRGEAFSIFANTCMGEMSGCTCVSCRPCSQPSPLMPACSHTHAPCRP